MTSPHNVKVFINSTEINPEAYSVDRIEGTVLFGWRARLALKMLRYFEGDAIVRIEYDYIPQYR